VYSLAEKTIVEILKKSVHLSFCYKCLKILQKSCYLEKVQKCSNWLNQQTFFLHILIPWVLRNTWRGGDHQICEKRQNHCPLLYIYASKIEIFDSALDELEILFLLLTLVLLGCYPHLCAHQFMAKNILSNVNHSMFFELMLFCTSDS